jgi:hypothetical protein
MLAFAAAVLALLALGSGPGGLYPAPANAVPANDNLANAIPIATPARSGIVATGSNVGATTEAGENTNPCAPTGKTVWYTWTSPGTPGTAVFDTWGSDFGGGEDTVLAIYTGSGYPLSLNSCNDDAYSPSRPSAITLSYAASTTYRIQVGSWGGSMEGDIVLSMALGAALYVNSTADNDTRDAVLTLREAILVATGALNPVSLFADESAQIRNSGAAGASGSDLVHFLPSSFPAGSLTSVVLTSALTSLSQTNDVVSGIGAGEAVSGNYTYACFDVSGASNHLEGLRIEDCNFAAIVLSGAGHTVGGALPIQRNTVLDSSNGIIVGVYSAPSGVSIKGNYIGTDGTSTGSNFGMYGTYPNNGYGILAGGTGTVIGGNLPGEGNVVSGNPVGIQVSSSTNTTVYGNKVGTDPSGTLALPNNIGIGVGTVPPTILGPSSNTHIGEPSAGYGNIIAFNDEAIRSADSNATIRGNSIHSQTTTSIFNVYPPRTATPTIGSVAGGTVSGFTCAGCNVDVYHDMLAEGRTWLGSDTADGSGYFAVTGVGHALPNITALATSPAGATSEWSAPFAAEPNQDGDGAADSQDGCPQVPEDLDGFEDGDGCPDTDNDLDGVADASDTGKQVWDPAGALAAPTIDCKNMAEDPDGFKDSDGCPEPDNDNDGFPDHADNCPGTGQFAGLDGMLGAPQDVNHNGVRDNPPEAAFATDDLQLTFEDYDTVLDGDGCHDSPGDDFDGDGLADDTEVFTYLTLPYNPDSDADLVIDGADNCPNWPNTPQNLPPWTVPGGGADTDCDGFTKTREQHTGTDPVRHCNADSTVNNEADAWPSDFNDNRVTNLTDVVLFGPTYNKSVGQPGYDQRFDLNVSNSVSLADVVLMGPFYNKNCG